MPDMCNSISGIFYGSQRYNRDNRTEERIKKFGELSTKDPETRKRINEVIRAMLREVHKRMQDNAKSGLQMEDPIKAYKVVKMAYAMVFDPVGAQL